MALLTDENGAEDLKYCLDQHEIKNIDMWREINRFLNMSSSLDSVVTNNLARQICVDYYNIEGVPKEIREKLNPKQLTDIEDRREFMEDVLALVFDHILIELFPKYVISDKKRKRIRKKVTKSVQRDPFEDNDPKLVRYAFSTTGEKMLIACTCEKVIHLLTSDNNDLQYLMCFILTYGYYTKSPIDFLDLVAQRFLLVAVRMSKANPADVGVLKIILFKVVNLLKLWIETHIDVVKNSLDIIERIKEFANDTIDPVLPSTAENLKNYLETKLEKNEILVQEDLQFSEKPPKMKKLLARGVNTQHELCVEIIHPLEFARQMALVDHRLYRSIRPGEFLHLNWTRREKAKLAPNILKMISQFNRVGEWVVYIINRSTKDSHRVKLLTQLIEIAYESYKLANFNGAMALISGLKHNTVSRKKETWEAMSSASWDRWEEISEILKLDDNFSSLRSKMKQTAPPIIPYLGVFLSGLTFKDVDPNYTKDGLINIPKLLYVANVASTVKEGQTTPFCLQVHEPIQHFIENLPTKDEHQPRKRVESRDKSKRRLSLLRGGSMPSINKIRPKKPSNLSNMFNSPEVEEKTENLNAPRSTSGPVLQAHRRTNTLSPRTSFMVSDENNRRDSESSDKKKNRKSMSVFSRGSNSINSSTAKESIRTQSDDRKKKRMSRFLSK